MTSPVRTHIDDGIARITLDDGKVNALSSGTLAALAAALDEAEEAGAVVALSGRDGIFSAGFDLKTFQRGPEATLEMLRAGAGVIERLLAFPHPVLTVCTGHAYPMGAFLMLSADVRLGMAGPWRIGMNETAIGLTVPWFALELARHRLTSAGFARVPAGDLFGPEEALRLGYLDRVLAPHAIGSAVETELARLRALDRKAFSGTKTRVNASVLRAVREAVARELGPAAPRA